ncbi:N-acetyltransferase [Sagittula sp. NFXS13]|uniref:Putative N-acetyltransferase YhbS n=1 Tax=Sagittula marina TaxID=943940 RepID=A0A7W6DKA0_9RHOB|nr:N-acetyltransferase [Sagittula marina]MBB3984608.1 putative N-acetyltransferase YhbS [Sagittula marina]
MYTTAVERPEDWWEVEALYDSAFAPGRSALSSYRLREDVDPVAPLCRVARDSSGAVVAAIRYWPVRVNGQRVLLLGPIAVHPVTQGAGLGGLLMRETLHAAAEMGFERVLLVGDPPYYQRFGFTRLEAVEMPPPTNPERVLGLALVPGAWDNVAGEVTRAA